MEKKVEAILITPDNSTELLELKEFLKNHNIKSRNINSDLLEDLVFNDILINCYHLHHLFLDNFFYE